MGLIAILSFLIYFVALCFITLFCLLQFQLFRGHRRHRISLSENTVNTNKKSHAKQETFPLICIQLPVYNERYVLERLLDAVVAMDYPRERLEIQVLDDSDDETVAVAAQKVAELKQLGFEIEQVRRESREGFKAGALAYGMGRSLANYFAIFDADFVPPKDFLEKSMPVLLEDDGLALVQARWVHLNENYSLLTRIQALQLNIHFGVEQPGRMEKQLFLQFNGTAGVWRREAIEQAGGWTYDTLTEDLDLSYRVQLLGWRLHYMKELMAPAELPVAMQSYKSQQFRWMKGGAETAKKILPMLWSSGESFERKLHGSVHLLGSSTFLLIFLASLVSVPSLLLDDYFPIKHHYLMVFLLGTLAFATVFTVANESQWKIFYFPLYLAVFMGMSLHNSRAVWQGWLGKITPFVRTPKFNVTGRQPILTSNAYVREGLHWVTIMEGILALYFAWGVLYGLQNSQYVFVLYHMLLAIGFALVFWWSLPKNGVTRKGLFLLGMTGLVMGMMAFADRSDMGVFFVLFALAAAGALWGAGQINSLWGVLLAVALVRLPVFFYTFPLSEDCLRFYFDAALWAMGENPYLILPELWGVEAGEVLAGDLKEAWVGMNSAQYYTVYPSLSQYFFFGMHQISGGGLQGFALTARIFFLLADLCIVYGLWKGLLLKNRGKWAAGLYAFHPLVILEGVGHLHTEILAIALLTIALHMRAKHWGLALVFWGLAIGIKLIPLLAFPLILKDKENKQQWVGIVLVLLGVALTFLPFWQGGMVEHFFSSLDLYFRRFEFNASLYYIFRWPLQLYLGYNPIGWLGPSMGLLTALGIALIGSSWMGRRKGLSAEDRFAWIVLIYLLMATTLHPWYLLWGIMAGFLSRSWAGKILLVWSFLVVASYGFYENLQQIGTWWWFQYGSLMVAAVYLGLTKLSLKPSL